ncbi:MAG: class I tRNA ligase family protein, partial [Dehalococcoidia bacterium]|nr:class I tRNA ligase family protein [Dehalococcoidia bacterium]
MFRSVASRVAFPEMEQSILGWWQKNSIFERSIDARRGGRRFVFYEGPPTVNGSPGIHHVLARVFKDVVPRYRTMKG